MPKIFVLRHQLAEQQARLKQLAKGGAPDGPGGTSGSGPTPPSSSDEDATSAGPSQQQPQPQQPPHVQQGPLDLGKRPLPQQPQQQYAPRIGKEQPPKYLIKQQL